MSKKPVFSCHGSVRGGCGVRHRTAETAQECCDRDQRGCASVRGYSDRRVFQVPAGTGDIDYPARIGPIRVSMYNEEEAYLYGR